MEESSTRNSMGSGGKSIENKKSVKFDNDEGGGNEEGKEAEECQVVFPWREVKTHFKSVVEATKNSNVCQRNSPHE